jgi:Na+-driven multidrug efflux pump
MSELLARPISNIFVSYDEYLLDMTIRGFRIYAISFLICGFNIFASSLFTALNNGVISLLISIGRTFLFQILAVLLLPYYFGLDGVWMSIIVSELLSLLVTILFIVFNRRKYSYY